MEREIKFRVWLKLKKTLIEKVVGFVIDPNKKKFRYFRLDKNQLNGIATDVYDLKDIALMQFTGLQDRNGKDIYEGDIKRWKFNGHIWDSICYWSELDCSFRWKMIKHNEKQKRSDIDIPFETENDYYNYVINSNQRQFGFDSYSEIIGNIYENKDLL